MELSDATEKAPASPGIDPGTFRLVAQCLNHYATPGPGPLNIVNWNARWNSEKISCVIRKTNVESQVPNHYCSVCCICQVTGCQLPAFGFSAKKTSFFISPYFVFSKTLDYSPLMVMSALGKLMARFAVIDVFCLEYFSFPLLTWRTVKYM
jgi:hypothetical protein